MGLFSLILIQQYKVQTNKKKNEMKLKLPTKADIRQSLPFNPNS